MPTVLTYRGYRFFFYANEGENEALEPPHIHVDGGGGRGKLWLSPVSFDSSYGFSPAAERTIKKVVTARRDQLLQAWEEWHGH